MEDVDYLLALQLQEKLLQEEALSTNVNKENQFSSNISKISSVSAHSNKCLDGNSNSRLEQTSSLCDPSWEVIDPTPDIFALFAAFNERFFWGKLSAVEVKWSPQMTSCAGVCSYQGRGGLCSVRLSAPLLKLRPRSDLVNTLLHEMIHAYLFVTANNRDRDGHGPEFHKHMYRINKEAGTKITVYHTFHDEVRLYQQHWWRCNGPCQTRKPYFGFVKRAKNRAPGPNDLWWGNHQAECGGTYIKIKEPENYKDKTKKSIKNNKDASKSKEPVKDIRSFFPQPSTSKRPDLSVIPKSSTVSKAPPNVHGFNNLNVPASSPKPTTSSKPTASRAVPNIHGFNNSNSSGSNSKSTQGNSGGSKGFIAGGLKNKGSSTMVVPPRTATKTGTGTKRPENEKPELKKPIEEKPDNPLNIDRFKVFKSSGQVLGGQTNDRSKSKLLTLFSSQKQPPSGVHQSSTTHNYSSSSSQNNSSVFVRNYPPTSSSPGTSRQNLENFKTGVKRRSVSTSNFDETRGMCNDERHSSNKRSFLQTDDDCDEVIDLDNLEGNNFVSCPVCTVKLKQCDLKRHLDNCSGIKEIFSDSIISISDDEDVFQVFKKQEESITDKEKQPKRIKEKYTEHTLSSSDDDDVFEVNRGNQASKNNGKQQTKSNGACLEFTLSSSDDEVVLKESKETEKERSKTMEAQEKSRSKDHISDPDVPCPCCNKLVPNSLINRHLDSCLSEMALKDDT